MASSHWIIVSNRLPVKVDSVTGELTGSTGGLVSAIMGIKGCPSLTWVGALTDSVDSKQLKKFCKDDSQSAFSPLPVILEEGVYNDYYNGFCNSVLWPLLHYESDRVTFSSDEWKAYEEVNKRFADTIVDSISGNEVIWVHDFHLFLLPALLKEKRPDLKVGFFLHIPFPSSEIFRQLPVRKQLLEGVMASDLIGFHDFSYLRHFASSVGQVLGVDSNLLAISSGNKSTQLGVFPVSIDTDKFLNTTSSPEVQSLCREHISSGDECKFVLGVDRLDYIKGIKLKLKLFARYLEKYPENIGRVSLVQLAVPSRIDVPEYLQLKHDVEQLVGEINGEFGTAHYVPVRYIYGEMSFDELVALYRHSDALLVTSKRDGMNLVCLEYLVSQDPESPGVIVLSEFAGASATLSHARMINPWDADLSADVLQDALSCELETRKSNYNSMVSYLEGYTATDWADSFISALESYPDKYTFAGATLLENEAKRELLRSTSLKDRLLLFLDFDGTLAPICNAPEEVYLSTKTRKILEDLCNLSNTDVVVVSGREEKFLKSRLEGLNIGIASEHGSSYLDNLGAESVDLLRGERLLWRATVEQIMEDYSRRVPESFIERKKFGVAWHFRRSPSEFGSYQARRLRIDLEGALRGQSAFVLVGSKVVEVRAVEANKGAFIEWYLDNFTFKGEPVGVFAMGDDVTDEDMFSVVDSFRGASVKVGREDTCAQYCLKSQTEVNSLLVEILASRTQGVA